MIHSFWQDQDESVAERKRETERSLEFVLNAILPYRKNLSWYQVTVEYVRVKSQGSLNRKKHSVYRRIAVARSYCRRTYVDVRVNFSCVTQINSENKTNTQKKSRVNNRAEDICPHKKLKVDQESSVQC